MRELRVGVAGAGWVARNRHIPALDACPRARVVAVYDRDVRRARSAAEEFGVAAVDTVEGLLGQGLDAVSVCTSPWSHAEIAVAALEADLHVLVEKPMALDLSEATAMAESAKRAGRLLCVSHNFLFSRSVRKAERLLAGEKLSYGLGLQVSSDRRRLPSWYRELPGGLFLDESPHLFYTLQHFLGRLDVEGVRTLGDAASPDGVEIWLRGPRGPGQVTMVFAAPVSEWHVGLVGAERVVGIDLFRDIAVQARSDGAHRAGDVFRTSLALAGGHGAGFVSSGMRLATGRQFWGHDELVRLFVDAALYGGASPVDLADALNVVRVTDEVLADMGAS